MQVSTEALNVYLSPVRSLDTSALVLFLQPALETDFRNFDSHYVMKTVTQLLVQTIRILKRQASASMLLSTCSRPKGVRVRSMVGELWRVAVRKRMKAHILNLKLRHTVWCLGSNLGQNSVYSI